MHSKRRGLLVVLVGTDGSGKTTQAKELLRFLAARRIPTAYVQNRFETWALAPIGAIGRMVFLRRHRMESDYTAFSSSVRGLFRNRALSFLFAYYHLSLQVIHSFFSVRIPLAVGKCVVCERYVYDWLLNMTLDHGRGSEEIGRCSRLLHRLAPRPDLLFFIDVPEEVAYARKDDIPSVAYLRDRRKAYVAIAQLEGAETMPGDDDPRVLQDRIRRRCMEVYERNGS